MLLTLVGGMRALPWTSNNFALAGLVEAAGATHNTTYTKAAASLASCLVRAQAVSTALPSLNGAYMRAFDYSLWGFWGSSSDWGWGPWSVETGWTQGWIVLGLALREWSGGTSTTVWDLTAGSAIDASLVAKLCPVFFPPGQSVRTVRYPAASPAS